VVDSKRLERRGEMAEWLNVPPWKGGILERVSRVRIPVSPPVTFGLPSKQRIYPASYVLSIDKRVQEFPLKPL
jgi:hypothetical protein